MALTNIYALIDPRDGRVRYVGKTVQAVEQRLANHVYHARRTHTACARWICGLLKAGFRPLAEVLEVAGDDWRQAEMRWIAEMRRRGCDLLNHTAGGEGLTSFSHTAEAKARMSQAQKRRYAAAGSPLKGRKRPEEVLRKMSESLKGKTRSEEQRARMSETRKLIPITPEHRAKLSAGIRGKPKPPRSPEHCRRISEAARGRVPSPESNAARSQALTGVPKSAEHRAKLSEAAKRRYART